jgi:replication initiation and membrane attachment protein
MAQHWQELLAIDRYFVAAKGILHDYDRKILTFLYQPLIGAGCLSLYMTLWAELEENRLWSESQSHHSLMNFMDMNLQDIYEKRLKLEAIGLLKTFVKEEEGHRLFVYELQPPLTAEQFLSDGMLNIYLYRKIGKKQFLRIKRFFSEKTLPETEFKQVTRSFQDVFSSAPSNVFTYDEETKQDLDVSLGEQFIGRNQGNEIKVKQDDFNFDLLINGLHENLIPRSAFTPKVRESIRILAFLYGIDVIAMKGIVMDALTEDNEISIEELRKSARDWYQYEHNNKLPSLIEKTQPVMYRVIDSKPQTQEEELIYYFETKSPLQFLRDISGGSEPSKADIKIIEDVLFGQKLNQGVVNVLIDNVLRKTDMKLTKNYVEKIASHWARKNIKTVKEAMELAKVEHRQYSEWAQGKKNNNESNNAKKKKTIRTEKLPDWFDKEETEIVPSIENQDDQSSKKIEIEEMLKKLRS